MHTAALWFGFFGAWLLVAGPINQAALELQSEDIEFDRIRATTAGVTRPPKVSVWWWLLPPVHFVLSHRRRDEYNRAILRSMSDEDFAAMTSFRSKATGWLLVGAGGLLIAAKETYELIEGLELSLWLWAILVVSMFALSAAYTIVQTGRARQLESQHERERS